VAFRSFSPTSSPPPLHRLTPPATPSPVYSPLAPERSLRPQYHRTLTALLNAPTPVGAEARRLYAAHTLGTHGLADADIRSGWA